MVFVFGGGFFGTDFADYTVFVFRIQKTHNPEVGNWQCDDIFLCARHGFVTFLKNLLVSPP